MNDILEIGREVLKKEASALLRVMDEIGEEFEKVVEILHKCTGRVVFMGIGKSGIICKKIASTMSSIGTPSMFLHPADSLHGDIGMLQKDDAVVIVSNSGETEEIIKVIPWIKRMGLPIIVITGNKESSIAKEGDVVLNVCVDEACPYNLIPTSSTTATLALGDAIAMAIMEKKRFKLEDFANLHPGGTIGRKLFTKVEDLMHTGDEIPRVYEDTPMKYVILEMTSKRLGVTGVFNKNEELTGVITDGDLRRAIEKYDNILSKTALDVMTKNPKTIKKDRLATHALKKMEDFSITSLFVMENEEDRRPVGIIHIHDLLKAKIA
ncbi:MAG TPA: KpsF/GutQ family sugar-phosphate isomerase [Syntrophorhabdaceae bacterium]|nr:KpsF/GutQ family sugar-phosphate isomerase [Syntrophorhabdaceae bacterium]HPP05909.1 KpsF/GutQ family sugar-phosphate isomerase [Syntrophorhabdaceae bacterium]